MQRNNKISAGVRVGGASLLARLKSNRHLIALIVVIWLFLFMTSISKTMTYYLMESEPINLEYIILRALLIWGIAALLAPLYLKLARRFPLEGERRRINLFLHVVVSLIIVPIHASLYRVMIMQYFSDQIEWSWSAFTAAMPTIISWLIVIGPLTYWLVVGAYYLKTYYNQYQERKLRTAELEAELASVQLHVLKIQLHPHFLFNTLHNINSLIYEDPDLAERVLELLKKLLRKSVEMAGQQEVTLTEEMDLTRTYLKIEKTRYGDNLEFVEDIEDAAWDCQVPNLMLQPLVENSIKHGISKKTTPGMVRISARIREGVLILRVEDNGPGLGQQVGEELNLGIGLKNNLQRLEHLYEYFDFGITSSELGGVKVEIKIPVDSAVEVEF